MGEYKRILVVDDDEKVLFIMQASLKKIGNGIEVVTAGSGQEALKKIMNNPFELVISDVRMPGVDGIALVEIMRDFGMDTPVIWISAYGCKSLQPDCKRLNVLQCLEKPLRIEEIRQAALQALPKNSAVGE